MSNIYWQRLETTKSSLSCCLLPHGLEHSLHLLSLPLGKVVGTNPLLQELQAPLLLANPEQLLCSPLVRSKARHLPDQVSHKLVVLGQPSLGFGWLGLQCIRGIFVTFLQTYTYFIPRSHGENLELLWSKSTKR